LIPREAHRPVCFAPQNVKLPWLRPVLPVLRFKA
jgi:hypothetical protein